MKYRAILGKWWHINKQCNESKKEVDYSYLIKQKHIH